jgi:hypothetical protein
MSKSIRNTFFTIVALVLTGLGVSWNEEVARQRTPVAIGQTVLAEFAGQEQSAGDFRLELELSRSTVLLGQFQVVTLRALPYSDLELTVRYQDGSFASNLSRRVTADELGRYTWRFQVNDFKAIGPVEVLAKATAGDRTAARRTLFTVQTWSKSVTTEEFTYPLVP